ncbi:hypothetical protein NDU88_009962 [Pleurodeles waltl]|uniref:Uncharacterized protein n=1 Tax=Pleurodeles waltl TaxID=8319 RepID=A0AAV7PWU7_PLEWA|nr:hypothetical protein NDU88_009962 [Pleurodeles waltl]
MSSGQEPIGLHFWVTAGSSSAVTRIQKDDTGEFRHADERTDGEDLGGAADREGKEPEDERSERYSRSSFDSGRSETSREDLGNTTSTARRHRGPGGFTPELRPRSGKSVAPAGARAGLISKREGE